MPIHVRIIKVIAGPVEDDYNENHVLTDHCKYFRKLKKAYITHLMSVTAGSEPDSRSIKLTC